MQVTRTARNYTKKLIHILLLHIETIMILDQQKDSDVIAQIEATLNGAYLGGWERDSAEGRLAVENEVFRRYNQASQYAVPWVNRVAPLAGSQVVEIGCGTGSSTAAFARLAGHVHGYDIEASYVAGAKARAQVLGLENGVNPR